MNTILVPTDFSEASLNAAKYAVSLAKLMEAKVMLFNVYEIYVPIDSMAPVQIPYIEVREASEASLKSMKAKLTKPDSNVHIGYAYIEGSPSLEINSMIKTIRPELVVMGMQTKNSIGKFLSGSTTTSIIEKSHVPVLVIPSNVRYKIINKLVYAYDLNTINKSVNVWLSCFVSMFNPIVDVLILVKDLKNSKVLLKATEKKLSKSLGDIPFNLFFEEEMNPEWQIEKFVKRKRAGLLVTEHRTHNFLYRLINGSVTKDLAFEINIPLLSIPERLLLQGKSEKLELTDSLTA